MGNQCVGRVIVPVEISGGCYMGQLPPGGLGGGNAGLLLVDS
jgi:hypothetical protein